MPITMTTSARGGSGRAAAAPPADALVLVVVELEPGGGRGRAGGLGPARSRDRDHDGREPEQPRQRRLRRRRTDGPGGLCQRLVTRQAADPLRPAQGRVRDEHDPLARASLHHPAAQDAVVERAQPDLHSGDRSQGQRLVEQPPVHVADADPPGEALGVDPLERPHGGRPRGARVGRVEQVEVDLEAVERGEAGLAVGHDGPGAPVRNPGAAGAGHAALGDDAGAPLDARLPERARQEGFILVVGPGGVEDRDPGFGSRHDRLEPAGGEAHAAQADPQLVRLEPAGRHPSCQRVISSIASALVRSRCTGVTAILPSATARKSVSGSSW
jgi:hypothetical protein